MIKYSLDFVLHTGNTTMQTLKNSLTEFCEDLHISEQPQDTGTGMYFAIEMRAEDPTLIFDICSQFGRIRSVKVEEV
jgi:hypothetical protein